jgi:hypothetical protein
MDPSKLVAYAVAAIVSLSTAYFIGRYRWPRWAYWSLAIACFTGSILIVDLFHSWSAVSPWPHAIRVGLVAVAGATAGLGFHGGLGAHLRPDNSK